MYTSNPAGFKTDKNLRKWVQKGVKYVETLPPKKPKQLNLSKSQLIKAEPFVEFFIPPPNSPSHVGSSYLPHCINY